MNLVTASKLKPRDKCVQWDVWWTELEYLMCDEVGESSTAFLVLQSGANSTGKRLVLPGITKVFKSPYGSLEGPDPKDQDTRREALKVRHIASHFISNSEGHALLDDLLVRLKSFFPKERMDFVVGCLKCSIAIRSFSVEAKFKTDPRKLVLSMSQHQQDQERHAVFSASFADELQAQAARVETLKCLWEMIGRLTRSA